MKAVLFTHICATLAVAVPTTLSACSKHPAGALEETRDAKSADAAQPRAASVIRIDGSSTVYPITEAVAEEFQKDHAARVTIGISGTGGGFKKLCAGEVAVTGASRPIKASEEQLCQSNKVEYVELPIAYDGLAVVVHPSNNWVKTMTIKELKLIWQPGAQQKVTSWNQVREGWPERPMHLFGAGVDSGTYDYFTKAVVGAEHSSRGDYTSSEDDNVLVQGVSRDPNAIGFFGLAYFEENRDKLKLVPIDDGDAKNGEGAIAPTSMTVSNGTYQPLSRPIFVYVAKSALTQPDVTALLEYYLENAPQLVQEARYIPLPASVYALAHKRLMAGKTGSLFAGNGSKIGVTIESLLAQE